MSGALPLSTLNALTATGQVVHAGAYHAARLRLEHSEEVADPARRAKYIADVIRWQEDAAELSAMQREHYAADNLVGAAP